MLNGSYDDFKKYAKDFAPVFDVDTRTLTTAKGHSIGGEFVENGDVLKNRFVV